MEENKNHPENEPKPGFLKSILDGHEEGYDAAVWDRIDAALPQKRKRRFFFWWWAGALLLSGLAGGYFLWNQTADNQSDEVAVHQELPSKNQVVASEKKGVESNLNENSPAKITEKTSPETPLMDGEKETIELASEAENQDEGSTESVAKSNVENKTKRMAGVDKIEMAIGKQPADTKNSKEATSEILVHHPSGRSQDQNEALNKAENEGKAVNRKRRPGRSGARKNQYVAVAAIVGPLDKSSQNAFQSNEETGNRANQKVEQTAENDQIVQEQKPGKTSETLTKNERIPPTVSPELKPKQVSPGTSEDSASKKTATAVLVLSSDSSAQNLPKDSSEKKLKRPAFWMVGAAAGSLFQQVQLSDYQSDEYASTNRESNLKFNANEVKPTLMLALQANRIWPVWGNLQLGLRVRGGWVYQELKTELLPGKYSASRFTYAGDSLTFEARSIAETGTQSYRRTTWFADAGVLIQFKSATFPVGVGIHFPLARFQQSTGGPAGSNASAIQYFIRPPDLRLWVPIFPQADLFAESLMMDWGNFALPIPVENKGRNVGIVLGAAWRW